MTLQTKSSHASFRVFWTVKNFSWLSRKVTIIPTWQKMSKVCRVMQNHQRTDKQTQFIKFIGQFQQHMVTPSLQQDMITSKEMDHNSNSTPGPWRPGASTPATARQVAVKPMPSTSEMPSLTSPYMGSNMWALSSPSGLLIIGFTRTYLRFVVYHINEFTWQIVFRLHCERCQKLLEIAHGQDNRSTEPRNRFASGGSMSCAARCTISGS